MKYLMKAKSIDMFGQKINLKFDKIGDTFNTPYGIITSILIFTIVGLFSGTRFFVLIKWLESNVSSVY